MKICPHCQAEMEERDPATIVLPIRLIVHEAWVCHECGYVLITKASIPPVKE